MTFKDWARNNVPRTNKPPKQSPKTTDHVISTETVAQSLEFQPGDHIHYTHITFNGQEKVRFGIFIRNETFYFNGENVIWAGWGDTPTEARNEIHFPTHVKRDRVRAGWPIECHEPIGLHNVDREVYDDF